MPKNDYEELLPVDPIGAINKMKENYCRYFNTMYRFNSHEPGLDEKRRKALEDPNGKVTCRDPYVEMLPEYQSMGMKLDQCIASDPELNAAFNDFPEYVKLIDAGLMSYPPYKHQVDMLKTAFVGVGGNHNAIITSGTGSGKTESFMLPLLASLLKEAKTWGTPNYQTDWMSHDSYDQPFQRQGEQSDRAAIRALVMYPMNALVADQLSRLREALDSDKVRKVLDSDFKGNRIFFGQYNSATIGGSKTLSDYTALGPNKKNKACNAIAEKVTKLSDSAKSVRSHIAKKLWQLHSAKNTYGVGSVEYNNAKKEYDKAKGAQYITPYVRNGKVTSEMVTRWDMQACPPDILITNYSMLSIMMMRHTEKDMIDKTRAWFQGDPDRDTDHPTRIFHLIIDELHLYRNTAGTEIAYLIRQFLNSIGVPPTIIRGGKYIPNPQLRILASSASLGSPQETEDFARQFFGVFYGDAITKLEDKTVKAFNIVEGTDYIPVNADKTIDYNDFNIFLPEYVVRDDTYKTEIKESLFGKYGYADLKGFLTDYADTMFADIKKVMTKNVGVKPTVCPIDVSDLCKALKCGMNALRGFFIFRADEEVNYFTKGDIKLPRFRFHQYFRYVDGLWGELTPPDPTTRAIIGDVMFHARALHKGHKVLELMRCECCGEMYIGGNVHRDPSRPLTFSLNSPVLDKIPNNNPTPMVQNKKYSEYAVFWPKGDNRQDVDIDDNQEIRKFPIPGGRDLGSVRWCKAWLNPYDGTCTKNAMSISADMIPGYLYTITGSQDECPALPAICPHCGKDYSTREHTFSPIRSFRTGIKRNNQILSKELMCQLPSDDRKLIGFSDSRQDAAEQAMGIALEHYRDMVRLLFMQEIDKAVLHDSAALTTFKNNLSVLPSIPNQSMLGMAIAMASSTLSNDEKAGLNAICADMTLSDNDRLQKILNFHLTSSDIPLKNFVTNERPGGLLVDDLLGLGINPGGTASKVQKFGTQHWSEHFNIGQITDYHPTEKIDKRLAAAIFRNSFGQFMGVSTEEVGLGYITYKFNDKQLNQLTSYIATGINAQEFMNAVIRVLGDFYRYEDPDGFEDRTDIQIADIKPLKKVLAHYLITIMHASSSNVYGTRGGLTGTTLTQLCSTIQGVLAGVTVVNAMGNPITPFYQTIVGSNMRGIQLPFEHMLFHRSQPGDQYYICEKCGRVHLHMGMGICTNSQCGGKIVQAIDNTSGSILTVDELRKNNYIAHDIDVQPRDAFRMHTEELTGQTDDQSERLLQFKGIILNTNPRLGDRAVTNMAKAKEIDMLNVTTTMEVGVDIGSLLAVYQGNMPPTRYNYQQRVGRGGRRGQAFSAAITFCRGKSHDSYYYDEGIAEMTGGKPATPKLVVSRSSNNDTIAKRVIAKSVLKQAFPPYNVITHEDLTDTCGEFGYEDEWESKNKDNVQTWINDNHEEIENIVKMYMEQYASGCISNLVDWVEKDLVNLISNIVKRSKMPNMGLAQCLAENGVLPMYGMPSSSRMFYHGYDKNSQDKFLSIDRPLEQSITEFAPGAIKSKDHGNYRSDGLTVPPETRKIIDLSAITQDERNRWNALENMYCMTKTGDIINGIDKYKGRNHFDDSLFDDSHIRVVIPKAYRAATLENNRGDLGGSNDRGNYSQAILWAMEGKPVTSKTSIGNVEVSQWHSDGNQECGVWYINDNMGRLFEGRQEFRHAEDEVTPAKTGRHVPMPTSTQSDAIAQIAPNFMDIHHGIRQARQGNSCKIALGAKKCTELIKLELNPDTISSNLCLDTSIGYRPAIIAAFYSAATLIQRVFADEMDIVPEELEITEVRVDPTTNIPVIYLNDSLVNGSGFVNMLVSPYVDDTGNSFNTMMEYIFNRIVNFQGTFMQSIKNHAKSCHTSCVKCLQTFYNAGYHHVLDWRLGVDIIKLMLDASYDMGYPSGYASDLSTPYDDLKAVIDQAGKNTAAAHNGVSYDPETMKLTDNGNEKRIIHPLWKNSGTDLNTFELFRVGYNSDPLSNLLSPTPVSTSHTPSGYASTTGSVII